MTSARNIKGAPDVKLGVLSAVLEQSIYEDSLEASGLLSC